MNAWVGDGGLSLRGVTGQSAHNDKIVKLSVADEFIFPKSLNNNAFFRPDLRNGFVPRLDSRE